MKKLFIILALVCSLPCVALADLDIGSLLNLAHAILSVTPPTPSPEPSPTPAPVFGVIYKDGKFSEYTHIKYEPYNYFEAYYNTADYNGTYVVAEGTVSLISVEDDTAVVFFDVDGKSSQQIMFFVEGKDAIAQIQDGDYLLVQAMAGVDSTAIGLPVKYAMVHPIIIEKR